MREHDDRSGDRPRDERGRGASQTRANGVAKANDTATRRLGRSPHPVRLTAVRLARIAERLDERDLSIVLTMKKVRVATGRQLQRLHFNAEPKRARQARRILARLVDLSLLNRLDREIGGRRAGSSGFVYSLGLAGQRLTGNLGPAGGGRVEQPWTPSPPYLNHFLAVAEVYVRLREQEHDRGAEILDFQGEPKCWRPFMSGGGERIVLKPDAFVRVAVGEFERLHFIEVDCATESPRTIEGKLSRHLAYARSGIEQDRWGVHPFVTWLVPDDRRVDVIVGAIERLPMEMRFIFNVASFETALDVIWGERA